MKVSDEYSIVTFLSLPIVLVLMVSSCAPPMYFPTQQTIPLVKEKKGLRVTAALSMPSPLYSVLSKGRQFAVNSSLTYAITNNLTVYTSAMTTFDSEDNRKNLGGGFGYQFQLASNTFLQAYFLGSKGNVDSEGDVLLFWGFGVYADISTISFQPQITTIVSPRSSFTISTGVKNIYYQIIENQGQRNLDVFSDLRFEPSLSWSYEPSKFGFLLELGSSLFDSGIGGPAVLNLYGSMGLTYCFTCKN